MRRPAPIVFIFINIIITALVAFAVLTLFSNNNPPSSPITVYTVEVRITNTPDPNTTPIIRIITATPQPGTIGLLPTGIVETSQAPINPPITLDAQSIQGNAAAQSTVTALPENCLPYVIAEGDTPFGIAFEYDADFNRMMEVNGLTEDTASLLQIGDVLIIPLEGCPLQAATPPTEAPPPTDVPTEVPTNDGSSSAVASATPGASPTAQPTATTTLPPTAVNAQVSISEVVGAGDITSEGVVIRNQGNPINLNGWTLIDSQGNQYLFTERLIFANASVTLFTRGGVDTPILLFWNQSAAIFEPGDTLTLRNKEGQVQSTLRVPAPQNLP